MFSNRFNVHFSIHLLSIFSNLFGYISLAISIIPLGNLCPGTERLSDLREYTLPFLTADTFL